MADLPMAQIPNFSLGATPNTNAPAMGIQGAQGGGAQALQGIQLAQQQQQLQMQKTQQSIQQVDTLIKNGIELPGLLPSFWPTIATKMNEISPDYKLDPRNPPSNLTSFSKALSDISDGVQGGIISMPQAHSATQQLIKTSFPTAQGALGDIPTASAPGPQGPVMQPGDMGQGNQGQPGMAQPPQPGVQPSQQPPSPVPDLLTAKAQYDKGMALISQAPLSQQTNLRKQLEESSLGQNYKQLTDQHFKDLSAQYSEGEQNKRNEMNQNNEMVKSAVSNFQSQGKEFNNVADNFSAFNHLMQLGSQMETQGADTTATVNAEKTALLNFAQMAYPGTGRPGNAEMLDKMEKSGPYGTLIEQALNKLDKGDIMTGKQVKGLRQAALALYQGRETQHSQLENSYAQNIKQYGGNPNSLITNIRPQSVVSTSPIHQTQSSDKDPLIGHVMKTAKGNYQYLGGNKADRNNWAFMGESNE